MSQHIPYDDNKFDRNGNLEDIINTLDFSDIGCIVEVDMKHADEIKQKNFHLLLRI